MRTRSSRPMGVLPLVASQRKLTPPGDDSLMSAWMRVLPPLRAKLMRLHEDEMVECAVLGYVKSEASDWRRFWTRRAGGGCHQVCVAPRRCDCALCATRAVERAAEAPRPPAWLLQPHGPPTDATWRAARPQR